MKILVSPCLIGICSRWDESRDEVPELVELVRSGQAVFMCPEQIGGLPTPREPSETEPGRTAVDVLNGQAKVFSDSGKDVTREFLVGAERVLEFCQRMGIGTAILKAYSPSCGSTKTYDGTFTETIIPGRGITAELLEQNGVKVYNEINYPASIIEAD